MGMTMTQKILAAHAGLESVEAGQLIEAKLDVVMANDITGPMAVPVFRKMADKVFDKDKYSCWNEEMRQYLRDNNVDKVYFAGVNTGCCVLHSAFDFYDDLVDCTVIEDLCGSTSGVKEHEEGIAVLRSCITKERVVTAEEALKEINLDLWGNFCQSKTSENIEARL